MKYFFIVLYVYLLLFSLTTFAFILKSKTYRDIYKSYIVDEPYHVWYVLNDGRVKDLFRNGSGYKYFRIIFVFILLVVLFTRYLLILPVFISFLYYVVKITYVWLFKKEIVIMIPNKWYETRVGATYIDLLIFVFIKQPRWLGFTYAYRILNIRKNVRKDITTCIRIFSLFTKTLVSVSILGISCWTLAISMQITEDLIKDSDNFLSNFPKIVINVLKAKFNKLILMSKDMRIYVENGVIIFNPNTNKQLTGFTDLCKIKTHVKGGRVLIHYGITNTQWAGSEEYDTSIQMTGTPIDNSRQILLKTINYRQPACCAIWNILRDSSNVSRNYQYHLLKSWGLDSRDGLNNFHEIVFAKRIVTPRIPVIYEGVTGELTRTVESTNYAEEVISQKNKINLETLKIYDIALNSIRKESKYTIDDVSKSLNDINYLNYHINKVHYSEILTFLKEKSLKDAYAYGAASGLWPLEDVK